MTHPRSGDEAVEWMIHQINHPTQDWRAKCQSSVRQALGLPAWAPSARIAFEHTPHKELHPVHAHTHVPKGAIVYGLTDHTYGHAWLAGGHNHQGAEHQHAFSVDYRRRGQIDRVPLMLPHWTHNKGIWFTTWTPFGHIKVAD